jgi:hypothetical protein
MENLFSITRQQWLPGASIMFVDGGGYNGGRGSTPQPLNND